MHHPLPALQYVFTIFNQSNNKNRFGAFWAELGFAQIQKIVFNLLQTGKQDLETAQKAPITKKSLSPFLYLRKDIGVHNQAFMVETFIAQTIFMFETFMVEKFLVEKCGPEKSGVEAWGWNF